MNQEYIEKLETELWPFFRQADKVVEFNQRKVLEAFRNQKVSDSHFNPTTGYGYDDYGRDTLEAVYAEVFRAEDALVRPQLISGTHAISTALFGLLRPGDELLYITGKPYDTLEGILEKGEGSLKDYSIGYQAVELLENGSVDWQNVQQAVHPNTKVIGIQRSRGYDTRPSFTIEQIEEMIQFVKEIKQDVIVFVDNCYGEFVETREPIEIGADIMAGSLIKNPGGGIARIGGYIVGKKELIEKSANRLTAPGLGKEIGASLGMLQEMFQGFFLAPHVVGEALKGAIFSSRLLSELGFQTNPAFDATRTDLIQAVNFKNAEQMVAFCQAIQAASPINAHVTPYPSPMPGYEDDVIMAAGTFIQGASLELTADGPIRPPFTAFVQGGLTYAHVKVAIMEAVGVMEKQGLLPFRTK
ncbi:methionine gamma-lyase family protein [Radiobacillus deserti]|uniref:Methionine gamma-lyase family protein n=1 Tax=Radiobacillus deserti TaxID=2594883 RepID=A0A516KFU9_9BACI|nr:methionine gamma-lyase family protein [Radiobacillus deserti]QDP40271.1 methionine gamma-lyase family protein [Radiobacillus deserti]